MSPPSRRWVRSRHITRPRKACGKYVRRPYAPALGHLSRRDPEQGYTYAYYAYSDQNHFAQRFTFVLIRGTAGVKRPSGGRKGHADRVIPHCAGPPHYLLRHSLPAHPSLPLSFADLIRVYICEKLCSRLEKRFCSGTYM